MKLDIDMFIRTKEGIIARIEDLQHLEFHDHLSDTIYCDKVVMQEYGDTFEYIEPIDRYIIKNASHNIIDLIEVGDYVNGYKVLKIDNQIRGFGVIVFEDNDSIREDYIYTILTHEQYEANAYKLGDEPPRT